MQNVALITGSYGGLGTGFVDIHTARHGDLILVGRSEEKLNAQAKEVTTKYGVEVRTIAVDLSTPEAAQTIVDACADVVPDIIINNAGFGGQGDFARERSMDQDLSMIAVNIEAPTRLLKLFLPKMIERGSGKVLAGTSRHWRDRDRPHARRHANRLYRHRWAIRYEIICERGRAPPGGTGRL